MCLFHGVYATVIIVVTRIGQFRIRHGLLRGGVMHVSSSHRNLMSVWKLESPTTSRRSRRRPKLTRSRRSPSPIFGRHGRKIGAWHIASSDRRDAASKPQLRCIFLLVWHWCVPGVRCTDSCSLFVMLQKYLRRVLRCCAVWCGLVRCAFFLVCFHWTPGLIIDQFSTSLRLSVPSARDKNSWRSFSGHPQLGPNYSLHDGSGRIVVLLRT